MGVRDVQTSRRLAGLAVVLALGVLVACARMSDSETSAGPTDSTGEGRTNLGFALDQTVAEDLEHLVRLSDAVVIGAVVNVREGRELENLDGPVGEEGETPPRFIEVALQVDDVLYGEVRYQDPDASTMVFEEGFGIPPTGSLPGDSGVYFVIERPDDAGAPLGFYGLTTSQGRFIFGDEGVQTSNRLRAWEEAVEGTDSEAFLQQVHDAIAAVEADPSPSVSASSSRQ